MVKPACLSRRGSEADLLAGDMDSKAVPTPGANVWFTRGSLFVEAPGELLSEEPESLSRWVRALHPLTDSTRTAGVILCCDSQLFAGLPSLAGQGDVSRRARAQLQVVRGAFGANIPVYVVFTKFDVIPYFAEYFATLTPAEERQVLGCTLPVRSKLLSDAFNRIYAALATQRLIFLERETEAAARRAIYEFPREFKRIRGPLLQFLTEIFPERQDQGDPVLRGFYFTGTREVDRRDVLPNRSRLAETVIQTIAGVTQLFDPKALEETPGATTRWVFVTDLFQQITDSRHGTHERAGKGRRLVRPLICACIAGLSIVVIALFLNSWFHNRALLREVAAAALQSPPLPPGAAPSRLDLQRLQTLGDAVEHLTLIQKGNASLTERLDLNGIGGVLDPVRRLYYERFRQYFLDGIVHSLEAGLSQLPDRPSPSHAWEDVYADLSAYRTITTSAAERSCSPDSRFADWLLTKWRADHPPDPVLDGAARANFELYADGLTTKNLRDFLIFQSREQTVVQHARDYLDSFPAAEARYHRLIEQVNREMGRPARLSDLIPGTEYQWALRVRDEVPAAFTRPGWERVHQAIDDIGRIDAAGSCVLGTSLLHPVAASALSSATVKQQLRDFYTQDYIRHWHDLLAGAAVVPYDGCGDAAHKLSVLSQYNSPVLALLLMTAENTTFSGDSLSTQAGIAAGFQPAHAVFDSSPPDRSRRVDRRNKTYLKSLGNLERAMKALDLGGQCDSSDGVTRDQANQEISSALAAVAEFERNFNRVDTYDAVKDLLEGPLLAAQAVISHASTSRVESSRSAKKAE